MKYYTAKALGRVLGMGADEITTLTKRGIIKKGVAENGLYTLEESAREIIAGLSKPEDRRAADYATERARLMRARRQSAEHDLALMEKELHTSEDVERTLSLLLAAFKAKVRAIPSRMAPQCAKLKSKEEIFDLLKAATDETLQELASIETLFESEEGEPADGAPGQLAQKEEETA